MRRYLIDGREPSVTYLFSLPLELRMVIYEHLLSPDPKAVNTLYMYHGGLYYSRPLMGPRRDARPHHICRWQHPVPVMAPDPRIVKRTVQGNVVVRVRLKS